MVQVSVIDQLEREMEEDYRRVVEKDAADGKDFNKAAYDHMKI